MQQQLWQYLSQRWDNADKEKIRIEEAVNIFFDTISRNEWDLVAQLIKKGCTYNMRQGHKTALMHACEYGATETVNLLLKLGAEVGAQDEIGKDALHYAIESGMDSTIDSIIRNNPKIKRIFSDNSTALILATKLSYVYAVKQLVKFIPSCIDMYDREGRTALWHVLSKPSPTDEDNQIAKILLDSGADPDIQDISGISPKEAAVTDSANAIIERHDIDQSIDNDITTTVEPSPPTPKKGLRL